LSKITKDISFEINKSYIGEKYKVLTTEIGKNNTIIGRAENYKPVILNEKNSLGKFINVEIIESAHNYLVGNII
jgi:tRNA A37 methylthiotransferase MiaB